MRLWILFALVGAAGCKKKEQPSSSDPTSPTRVLAKMSEYADQMCACKDKACADKVHEAMTKWSADVAALGGGRKAATPDERTMKELVVVGERYGQCMATAMSPTPVAAPAPVAATDAPPAPKNPRHADEVLQIARTWAEAQFEDRVYSRAVYSYIDAQGELDADDGSLTVSFGRAIAKADRRVGAPVKQTVTQWDCPELTHRKTAWEVKKDAQCYDTIPYAPRCTPSKIWQRAIEKKAPPDAVAVITIDTKAKQWTFEIKDEPSGLAISETFPDDCEIAVEK